MDSRAVEHPVKCFLCHESLSPKCTELSVHLLVLDGLGVRSFALTPSPSPTSRERRVGVATRTNHVQSLLSHCVGEGVGSEALLEESKAFHSVFFRDRHAL